MQQGAGGVCLHLAGIAHKIGDGQNLKSDEDGPAQTHAGIKLYACHILGHCNVKGVGSTSSIAQGHTQEDGGAAHDSVITQGHEDSHEDWEQAVDLLINAHGGAQNAQHQHGNGNEQLNPLSYFSNHRPQCLVHRSVLGQHIDETVGKDDQEHDVGRLYIALLQSQEKVKDTRGLYIDLMVGAIHDNHLAGDRILHTVVLACGDDVGQDQHQHHDRNQDHIGVRHFELKFLFLGVCHSHLLISPNFQQTHIRSRATSVKI